MKKNMEEQRKKKLVAFVGQELQRRAAERAPFELQWQLNMNFVHGNQYCDVAWPSGELYDIDKQYYWQEREVFNHIAPIIDVRLSRLSQVRPLMMVRPASGDESDRESARVSTDILHSVYYRLDMSERIKQAAQWAELCGTVFYKVTWDSEAMASGVQCGDVAVTVCPPFEIYPDSCESGTVEKCQSIIHASVLSCSEIASRYGVDALPEDCTVLGGIGTATKNSFFAQGLRATGARDSAMVMEYYERPTKEHKQGRLLIVAGEHLLYEGELPYAVGDKGERGLPFVRQCAVDKPACFFGSTVIERCIPVQRAYNAVKNRKHEYLNRVAFGVVAVEEGAVDMQSLEQDGLCPGKILVYRAGSTPPQMMPVGQLPSEFSSEEASLLQEFEMISGVSELMRRSYSGAASSGVALSLLNEQDNTRLAVTSEGIRDAAKTMGKMWLRLYKQYATEPRLMQVTGENGSVSLLYFKASMLSSDDVIHETENELSQSVVQRRQMLFDLLARGLFSSNSGISGAEKSRLLSTLGLGDWESNDAPADLQRSAAQRENEGLAQLAIGVADNHALHLAEHERFMQTEAFERMELEDPDRAGNIAVHYLEHKKALLQERGESND